MATDKWVWHSATSGVPQTFLVLAWGTDGLAVVVEAGFNEVKRRWEPHLITAAPRLVSIDSLRCGPATAPRRERRWGLNRGGGA